MWPLDHKMGVVPAWRGDLLQRWRERLVSQGQRRQELGPQATNPNAVGRSTEQWDKGRR